ncbi:hypothetical protein [Psychromarinibacter halotolerans]|nr:hypothetical protein [Psychromarinibacter halotolerans]
MGDVPVDGAELEVDWKAPLSIRMPEDVDVAEVSFNRYVLARGRSEEDLLGIPAYVLRGFRHRNFFVRRDSDLTELSQLCGRRLATNSWSDSGTLWARAALRDAGVGMDDVEWIVGQFDAHTASRPLYSGDLVPPADATRLEDGDTLMQALLEGRVDAITTAFAPPCVFTPDGPIRRLVLNYPAVEAAYHDRCGVYPAFHIMAFRRSYAMENPDIVVATCVALRKSWEVWWLKARRFAEASPWSMADLDNMAGRFADDTPPFGQHSAGHRRMLKTICAEQYAQGLVPQATDPKSLFAGFDEVLGLCGLSEADLFTPDELPSLGGRL